MADPNFTYVGDDVSPTFAAGVFNDAWERANERSDTAAARLADMSLRGVNPSAGVTTPVDVQLNLLGDVPVAEDINTLDPVRQAVVDQLGALLTELINKYYPPVAVPSGTDAWNRVVAAFNSGYLFNELDNVEARLSKTFSARGLSFPSSAAQGGAFRYLDRVRTYITGTVGSMREAKRLDHYTDFALLYYEQVMDLQFDALEACRQYLLEAVMPLRTRMATDQSQLARFKALLQSSYYKYLDAKIVEGGTELERLLTYKRIVATRELANEERRALVFESMASVLAEEALNVASQASAAINAINASVSVTGGEQL